MSSISSNRCLIETLPLDVLKGTIGSFLDAESIENMKRTNHLFQNTLSFRAAQKASGHLNLKETSKYMSRNTDRLALEPEQKQEGLSDVGRQICLSARHLQSLELCSGKLQYFRESISETDFLRIFKIDNSLYQLLDLLGDYLPDYLSDEFPTLELIIDQLCFSLFETLFETLEEKPRFPLLKSLRIAKLPPTVPATYFPGSRRRIQTEAVQLVKPKHWRQLAFHCPNLQSLSVFKGKETVLQRFLPGCIHLNEIEFDQCSGSDISDQFYASLKVERVHIKTRYVYAEPFAKILGNKLKSIEFGTSYTHDLEEDTKQLMALSPNLEHVAMFCFNNVTQKSIAQLTEGACLRSLTIFNTNLNDLTVSVSKTAKLNALTIRFSICSDVGTFTSLSQFSHLETLRLEYCNVENLLMMGDSISKCPSLRNLEVALSSSPNNTILEKIQKSASLRSLLIFPDENTSSPSQLHSSNITLQEIAQFASKSRVTRIDFKNYYFGEPKMVQQYKQDLAKRGITFLCPEVDCRNKWLTIAKRAEERLLAGDLSKAICDMPEMQVTQVLEVLNKIEPKVNNLSYEEFPGKALAAAIRTIYENESQTALTTTTTTTTTTTSS